jgi:hypothetical protein
MLSEIRKNPQIIFDESENKEDNSSEPHPIVNRPFYRKSNLMKIED